MPPRNTIESVLARVQFGSGCWRWSGPHDKDGYAVVTTGGKAYKMHRVMYQLAHGRIPRGREIDHLCRIRDCVNPDHLEAVPHAVNVGRGQSGEVNGGRNRAKTHCPKDHPYDETNTYWTKNGRRTCRACGRESRRKANA